LFKTKSPLVGIQVGGISLRSVEVDLFYSKFAPEEMRSMIMSSFYIEKIESLGWQNYESFVPSFTFKLSQVMKPIHTTKWENRYQIVG
jgi:hypothetical protein